MSEPMGEIDMLNLLGDALANERGLDQQRIARVGLGWITQLLRKNADYGSSVWKRPLLAPECSEDAAIRVRMTDKVERLASLLANKAPECDESVKDTVSDLGAYCLLWLAKPKEDVNA